MRDEADVGGERVRGIATAWLPAALAVLGVGLALFSGWQVWQRIQLERRADRLVAGGEQVFAALDAFIADRGAPPPPGSGVPGGFNGRTLAPLSTEGYLPGAGSIVERLSGQRVAAYDARDDQFWMVLRDRDEPRLVLLLARTDGFPLVPETWLEGVYRVEGSRLIKVELPPPATPRPAARRDESDGRS